MKYISKKFQKYMSCQDKKDYKAHKLVRVRYKKEYNKLIKSQSIPTIPMFGPNSKFTDITRKICQIDDLINDIEFKSFELAEKNICKEGNIICHDRANYIKYVIGEKKNRDHYTCYDLSSMSQIKELHWKTLVKHYSIDKISES